MKPHPDTPLPTYILDPDSGGARCIQRVGYETDKSSCITPSISLTLVDEPTDPCPAFHQGRTASYPTQVAPHDP